MTQTWRVFGHLVLPALLVGVPLMVTACVVRVRQIRRVDPQSNTWGRAVLEVLFVFSLLGVAAVTLTPAPVIGDAGGRSWDSRPFVDVLTAVGHGQLGDHSVLQFLANVVLLVPTGVLAAMLTRRATTLGLLVIGVVLGVSIEVLQMVVPLNRAVSVEDVVANGAGFFVGALVGRAALRRTPWLAAAVTAHRAPSREPR